MRQVNGNGGPRFNNALLVDALVGVLVCATVACTGCCALRSAPREPTVPELVRTLESKGGGERDWAAERLEQVLLNEPNPSARRAVVEAMGRFGPETSLVRRRTLADASTDAMNWANSHKSGCDALGSVISSYAGLVLAMGSVLVDPFRPAVLRFPIGPILHATDDKDDSVRQAARTALVARAHKGPDALAQITGALKSGATYERARAARAMGYLGRLAVPGIDDLAKAAQDAESGVRVAAGAACREVCLACRPDVEDPSPEVRAAAVHLLGTPSPIAHEFLPLVFERLKDDNANVRAAAADALGRLAASAAAVPDAAAADASRKLCLACGATFEDRVPEVRAAAARLLGYASACVEDSLPLLCTRLVDEDAKVRLAAAEALGRLGPAARPALGRLAELLKDPDIQVYHAAARAYRQIAE